MSRVPEVELLLLRLQQVREWLRVSPFGRVATLLGAFVIIYCLIGLFLISALFFSGVNPTLVISVVAAPMWIGVIWVAWKVASILFRKNRR